MKIKYSILSLMISSALLSSGSSLAQNNYGSALTNQGLNAADAKTLTYMKEEEKIARDVYITFYKQWNNRVFNKISGSEQRHMDALSSKLSVNNLPDPVVSNDVGVFTNQELASLFDTLVARGEQSELQALQVAAYVEELDIRDLKNAIAASKSARLTQTYNNLLRGSRNHLRAFVRQIRNYDVNYKAQLLSQQHVDFILNSEQERGNRGNGMGKGKRRGMGQGMGGRGMGGRGMGNGMRGGMGQGQMD